MEFIVIICIGLVALLFFALNSISKQLARAKDSLKDCRIEIEKLELVANDFKQQNIELSKYQGILDADVEARRILSAANSEAAILLSEANTKAKIIEQEIAEKKNLSNREIKELKERAEAYLLNAGLEAEEIVRKAKIRADEIAGDAYKALQNSVEYEKTAKAMRNVIEGYGDKYLKPTYSFLDDFAEEFGYTEAGQKLKTARDNSRLMIEAGTASKCDYVEENRKETAINFVLDAFNGKVDSILSKVRKDNYGTLEQKIKDAFQIVNHNGKAFRNAEITHEYLDSRLSELKWAVIVNELKWQEQEEQRKIKEQIREEEKARKEYEKALKEAEKEETYLKRAMEKAKNEIEKATDDQRTIYEAKLADLQNKLLEAEEKSKRAQSMAQQTKSGNVYVISNIGSFGENVFKIGMTRRLEPFDRIKELGDASVPFAFDVHSMIYSENAPQLENSLHKAFIRMQINKVNPRKEFFKLSLTEIKNEIEKMGVEVKWTMMAAATEYRETMAIEQEISRDPDKLQEWEKGQEKVERIIGRIDQNNDENNEI